MHPKGGDCERKGEKGKSQTKTQYAVFIRIINEEKRAELASTAKAGTSAKNNRLNTRTCHAAFNFLK
jgi:hypothetical protein